MIQLMEDIMTFVKGELLKELRNQGHYNTGKLAESVEIVVFEVADEIVGQLSMEKYWEYLNTGVPRNKIPFYPGSGRKESKYIEALIRYFVTKGFEGKQAERYAFATANAHKREGMPTQASYRFSNNNRRVGFLDEVTNENSNFLEKYIELEYYKEIEQAFGLMLDRINAA